MALGEGGGGPLCGSRTLVANALRLSPEGSGDLILLVHNLTGFWTGDVLEGEVEK